MTLHTTGSLQRKLWNILEPSRPGDRSGRVFDIAISTVIIVSILGNILSDEPWMPARFQPLFNWIETSATIIFLVEYLARLYSCKADPAYRKRWGRARWAISPLAVIDFLALLSGLLWFVHFNLTFLRVISLVRLFRLTRYSKGIQVIRETFRSCRHELTIVATGLFAVLFIAAGILHVAERTAQPEAFGSFLTSLWWAICTLTTVGYGDIYPITPFGRFCAAIIAVIGIGAFALPSGILAAHFNYVLHSRKEENEKTKAKQDWWP